MCGTQGYIAPENLGLLPRRYRTQSLYTGAVDIWSLGCLVHEIMTTETPFLESDDSSLDSLPDSPFAGLSRDTDVDLLYQYCRGDLDFPTEILENSKISKEGIDFVRRLLVPDPVSRMSAIEALKSPWLLDSARERQP